MAMALPQTPHSRSSSSDATATPLVQILRWTIVSLFLILILIISIAWYILNPREPGFQVSSISVSNLSAGTNSKLRGTYQIHLNITNLNKKINVRVDNFKFSNVRYGKVEISVANAKVQQPIYVNKKSVKEMMVEVELSLMKEDMTPSTKGVVKLNLRMKMNVRVSFEDGIWPTKEKYLDVYCGVEFLLIKEDTAKFQFGTQKKCIVKT